MNHNKDHAILILAGIIITLFTLESFIESKFPLDLFNASLVVMFILFIFYNKDRKINYLIALFGVNIFQWLISIYIIFNYPAYIKTEYFLYIIGAPFFTLVLFNIIHKYHLKTPENTKISMLKDKTKLIILFTGLIIIIGSLAGVILYYNPIFLYGITLGLITFIYGLYYEDKKVNISEMNNMAYTLTKNVNVTWNYIISIGLLLILQFFILCYFFSQITVDEGSNASAFSIMLTILFLFQIYRSDLKIWGTEKKITPNKKLENILGIVGIILFIGIFSAFYLMGSETNQTETNFNQINAAENDTILSNYSVMDTSYKNDPTIPTKSFSDYGISFNYPSSWNITSQSKDEVDLSDDYGIFQVQIRDNNGDSDEDIIQQEKVFIPYEWNKIASYKMIIDNKTAYEDIYTYADNQSGIFMRSAQIILVKDDKKYLLSFEAADVDFDEEKSDFAIILNSFKVDEESKDSHYTNPVVNPPNGNDLFNY